MKKIVLSLFILTILATISVSCTKDSTTGASTNNNSTTGGSLTATISSKLISPPVTFTAKTVTAVKAVDTGKNIIEVLAVDNNGNSIELYFLDNGVGTYPIAANHYSELAFYVSSTPSAECYGTSGTLTVTSFSSSNIQGTFSFNGLNLSASTTDSLKVTSGSFNFNYH